LFQRTGDDYYYNAPDYGYNGATATTDANNNDNHAYWRLLIGA
jgi:hypothetical protein